MKNRKLLNWLSDRPDISQNHTLLLSNLESMARIDDDALQNKFLKDLIRNYVALEKQVDDLLKNTLPSTVAEELKIAGRFSPRLYDCTILFTDFVGFTQLAEKMSREILVDTLHRIFTCFDEQIERFGGTKIKTIGDAYMAAFGAPIKQDDHAVKGIRAALSIIQIMRQFNKDAEHPFHLRVGMHSGEVMAGVVGKERMQFDVFGDDVNIASRFESSGVKDRINVSETTYLLAKHRFLFEERGPIKLKNKADMAAYFVIGEKQASS